MRCFHDVHQIGMYGLRDFESSGSVQKIQISGGRPETLRYLVGAILMRQVRRVAVLVLVVATGIVLAIQPTAQGSYHYLSPGGIEFASGLFGGQLDAENVEVEYNRMSVEQRATFEAVVHALESEEIDELVVRVLRVWGTAPPNPDGTLAEGTFQFRMSVELVPHIARSLRQRGYEIKRRGHVLLSSGTLVTGDGDVDSARQPGDPPKLQISWLQDDPQTGEVEIDYRPFRWWLDIFRIPGGHMDPNNSNVMASLDETTHYQLHKIRYGRGLFRWWP